MGNVRTLAVREITDALLYCREPAVLKLDKSELQWIINDTCTLCTVHSRIWVGHLMSAAGCSRRASGCHDSCMRASGCHDSCSRRASGYQYKDSCSSRASGCHDSSSRRGSCRLHKNSSVRCVSSLCSSSFLSRLFSSSYKVKWFQGFKKIRFFSLVDWLIVCYLVEVAAHVVSSGPVSPPAGGLSSAPCRRSPAHHSRLRPRLQLVPRGRGHITY